MYCQYTECRIPGWATSTFRLVCGALNEWARLDSRLGHELFFSVGFGVKKKGLGRVKKLKAFSILTKEMIKKTMHM